MMIIIIIITQIQYIKIIAFVVYLVSYFKGWLCPERYATYANPENSYSNT